MEPQANGPQSFSSPEGGAQQAENVVGKELDAAVKKIDNANATDQQKAAKKKDLGRALKDDAKDRLNELLNLERQERNEPDRNTEVIKEKRKEITKSLRKMVQAAKKGIVVNDNPKNQAFIESLASKNLVGNELANVFQTLDEYLTGSREITLSPNQGEVSDFESKVMQIWMTDAYTGEKIISALTEQAPLFGRDQTAMREQFNGLKRVVNEGAQQERPRGGSRADQIIEEYFPDFPQRQMEFLHALYQPEKYLEFIKNEKTEAMRDTSHVSHEVKEAYLKAYKRNPDTRTLNELVERAVDIEVSEKMSANLIDILTQLYRKLSIDKTHKSFDEIENEDFMHGITTTRSTMIKALQRLQNTFDEMEQANPNDPRLSNMYRFAEENYETREIDMKVKIKDPNDPTKEIDSIVKRPVTHLKALPYQKKVSLKDFIENQMSEFSHWREKTGYLHDVGLVYGHPPHEGSFYKQLGDYAEKIGGVQLDAILSLPDGEYMVEAFHLYTKLVQEEMAKIDHRILANMFTTQFGEIHTKTELEVKEYMKLRYGNKITDARLTSAINGAVGLGRGVYLSEPEMLAYTDPTNGVGGGGWQSYGTNDAGSLTVLNPLHLILRWQGQAHMRQVLFMEAGGTKTGAKDFFKSLAGQGYDHRESWNNAKKFMDGFTSLENGRDLKDSNLVIDKLMNLTSTAGLYQRGGWRNFHQFESHFTYDQNESLQLLKSFQSMDVIGYEAVSYFLKNIDSGIDLSKKTYLEKVDGSKDEFKQREALFENIYDNYFKPSSKKSYAEYIKDLRVVAEERVRKEVADKHTLPFPCKTAEEAIQKKISELFIQRTITREIAARFPTKFLRIDKDRFHKETGSRWRQVYEEMKKPANGYTNMNRDQFSSIMRDLEFAESLLRSDTSKKIQNIIHMLPPDENGHERSLGDHVDILYNLDSESVEKLLRSTSMSDERIKKTLDLYKIIKGKYVDDAKFLDGEAWTAVEKYPFTLGIENTDLKLIAYRGTGPRMVARQIKDIAAMEKVVKGFTDLPVMFKQIAVNGDFSPLTKYLLECQDIFRGVHGTGRDFEYNYLIAGMLINYMRKDQGADSWMGVGGIGSINSIAAEIAGSSNLIREWDTRDIQKFILSLQQLELLPKNNIDTSKGPEYEHIWKIDKLTKEIKDTGRQKPKEAYEYNIKKLGENFGGDWKAGLSKTLTEILPFALLFLAWVYLKKAFEETFGKKKG